MSLLDSFFTCAVNLRAHSVVRAGTVVGGIWRVQSVEDEVLFCVDDVSSSDASPKLTLLVRCLFLLELACFDMMSLDSIVFRH